MTSPSKWVTTPGPAGLVRIAWSENGKTRLLVVRTRKTKGGRLRVVELHLPDPTPTGLRELRLGAVERLVNTPAIRDALLERMGEDAPDVFSAFAGVTVYGAARLEASARIHVKAGAGVAGASGGGVVTLERPARLDDAFYKQVLRAYDDAAAAGGPILKTLMDASGAPRDTVARWLKEARRREKRLRAEAAA